MYPLGCMRMYLPDLIEQTSLVIGKVSKVKRKHGVLCHKEFLIIFFKWFISVYDTAVCIKH